MNRLWLFILLVILVLSGAGNLCAQENAVTAFSGKTGISGTESREDIFIGLLAETLLYSRSGISFGGGLVFGAGDGAAMGIRILYGGDTEQVAVLELNVFLRFYLAGPQSHEGLFIQVIAGPVLFAHESAVSFPANVGSFSAGLSAGWRFLLGSRWYVEPALRTGYPYIIGGGVSGGFRF